MLSALLGFAAAATIVVLLPGPDTLVVVRNLVRGGRRQGFATVCGVLTGLTVWMLVSVGNGEPDYFWPMWLLVPGAALFAISAALVGMRGGRPDDGPAVPDGDA